MTNSGWLTDAGIVVARLVYPMGMTGLDKVMDGLTIVYRDKDLVIVTDGPLFTPGWMTTTKRTSSNSEGRSRDPGCAQSLRPTSTRGATAQFRPSSHCSTRSSSRMTS